MRVQGIIEERGEEGRWACWHIRRVCMHCVAPNYEVNQKSFQEEMIEVRGHSLRPKRFTHVRVFQALIQIPCAFKILLH